jgi:hypothetical protein
MLQMSFVWGVLMSALKLAGLVACSWWLIWLPFPIVVVIGICLLIAASIALTGSVKFR